MFKNEQKEYCEKKISFGQPSSKRIVLIVGESMNYKYCFNNEDTPFLFKLGVFWRIGYSSSWNTAQSLVCFLNIRNVNEDLRCPQYYSANLFRLARRQKYFVTLLTGQSKEDFKYCGREFLDSFVSCENINRDPCKKSDEQVIKFYKNFKWHEKDFVVLHFRHAHSPYSEFIDNPSQSKDRYTKTLHDYKKVMKYHDNCMKQVIQYTPKDAQIIFVSDHGELINYQNKFYGHGFDCEEIHKIPVWSYPYLPLPYTHYEISTFIANLMGVKISNVQQS